jgi:hypothetical protein
VVEISIDVIYTLSKMIPFVLKPYKRDLSDVLNDLRFDKIKPVREASLEALNALKDVPD